MHARTSGASVEQLEARLAAEGLSAQRWGNGPADRYAVHAHGYDKAIVAAKGSIVFELPELGRVVELEAGDRLDPAGGHHPRRTRGSGGRHVPGGAPRPRHP